MASQWRLLFQPTVMSNTNDNGVQGTTRSYNSAVTVAKTSMAKGAREATIR
jgi:hypothetical protein